jgi:trk system potassium uptake protein TrkA
LKELDIRAKYGINIIAVKQGGNISAFPAGDYRFVENDVIVVLGGSDTVKTVQKL